MPKSLILVSSDHNTFTQFSSESFRCPLANFRRACTCAFLSRGTLRALQDFSPSWRSAGFLTSCPGKANALQSLAPTLIKFTYLWFSNDPEDIDWHAQVCLIRVRAKLCRKVDLVGQIEDPWSSVLPIVFLVTMVPAALRSLTKSSREILGWFLTVLMIIETPRGEILHGAPDRGRLTVILCCFHLWIIAPTVVTFSPSCLHSSLV